MRFVCDSCRAQYMISDDKVGAKGVKVRCKKCGYVILVRRAAANGPAADAAPAPAAESSASSGPMPFDTEEGASASDSASDSQQPESDGPSMPAPAASPPPGNGTAGEAFSGIQDDEIGAVFDQVLKSGPHKIEEKPSINSLAAPPDNEDLNLGMDDDLASTRAVSTDALKKLVAEAEAQAGASTGPKNGTSIPNDWFVAIDDAQQGPLTLEKVRELWNQGEIGPDSLAWRAGMADWVPLSEISILASELAPKPVKPVVAAPATSQVGTVVSIPVEQTVNMGGVARTVRTESVMSAGASDASVTDTGGWKPSAASALAALVSEEMSALSSKPKARSLLESGPNDRPVLADFPTAAASKPAGMFDIPSAPHEVLPAQTNGKSHAPDAPASAALTQSPNQPYAGPSVYGAPAYPAYTPPPAARSGMSGGVKAGIGAAAALVIALTGTVVYLATRSPEAAPVVPAAAVAQNTPPPVVAPPAVVPPAAATPEAAAPGTASAATAAAVPMPPPPAGLAQKPPETAAPSKPEPVAAAAPSKPEPSAARTEVASASRNTGTRRTTSSASSDGDDDGAIVARSTKPTPPPPAPGGGDEFDKLFGDEKPAKPAESAGTKKRQPGYIPPPPGGDVQDALGQSDIMSVVLANKSDIQACVKEMKAREPGVSGKLVVRWTIRTSGSTSGVSVQTAQFKDTYMGKCITGLVKGWKFPRHKTQGDPIDFPFTF